MYHATVNQGKTYDVKPGEHRFEGELNGEKFVLFTNTVRTKQQITFQGLTYYKQ